MSLPPQSRLSRWPQLQRPVSLQEGRGGGRGNLPELAGRERAFEVPISRGPPLGLQLLGPGPGGTGEEGNFDLGYFRTAPSRPGPVQRFLAATRRLCLQHILRGSNPSPAGHHHPFSASRIDPAMVPWATLLLLVLLFCCCLGYSSQTGAPRVYLTYK
ncbi:hypothetical protein E2320_016537, partial [Naja naja]